MNTLLDTCVISELIKPAPDALVLAWTGGRASMGRLAGEPARRGAPTSMADGLIAATAIRHGLRLATRNIADFKPFGVELVDPWKG